MISVRIPYDKDFDYENCKKHYIKNQRLIDDDAPFWQVVKDTFFYSFYDEDEFIGCIYCYLKDEKLFINAFATRHHHEKNLECIRKVISFFDCDIYAESIRKPAILCLLRTGFKKIKDNIYKYERK